MWCRVTVEIGLGEEFVPLDGARELACARCCRAVRTAAPAGWASVRLFGAVRHVVRRDAVQVLGCLTIDRRSRHVHCWSRVLSVVDERTMAALDAALQPPAS